MANIVGIFARGGSKGIPGKNIKMLGGKPLLAWSIDLAKQISSVDRIFVSTDCEKIAQVALEYGAEVPFMRPAELAGDQSPEWMSWQHLVDYCDHSQIAIETLISLPTTCPLRRVEHVQRCIDVYAEKKPDAVITVTAARRHPAFNMVRNVDGYAQVYDAHSRHYNRQETSLVYDISTAAYILNPLFIRTNTHLLNGKVIPIEADPFCAIDIDTPFDFLLAQNMLEAFRGVSSNTS